MNCGARPLFGPKLMCISSRWSSRNLPKPGKPPILPPAKTKRYRVVHVPWQSPDDVKELIWRRQVYNNAVSSIRHFYRQHLSGAVYESSASEDYNREIEHEFHSLLQENDRLNNEQLLKRETMAKEKKRLVEEEVKLKVENYKKSLYEKRQKLAQHVQEWTERSKEFVNYENLDEKIEQALESPVDHNFAIDVEGNIYKGKAPAKYSRDNLLLAKAVSDQSEALIAVGKLEEVLEEEPIGLPMADK